jgi:hypothetical protein
MLSIVLDEEEDDLDCCLTFASPFPSTEALELSANYN